MRVNLVHVIIFWMEKVNVLNGTIKKITFHATLSANCTIKTVMKKKIETSDNQNP